MRRRALFALGTLILAAMAFVACGTAESVDPAAAQAANDLADLKKNKPIIDEKRLELQQIRHRLAGKLPVEEAAEGEEGEPPTPEELEARVVALESEVESLTLEIGEKVVSYLNNSGILVGEELTEDQQFGVNVKIEEDMVVAQEYIDKGGDYSRALDIYNQSKQLDLDHAGLLAAIAKAQDLRFMTEDRFKQARKKMSQDEVREVLGQVMLKNVKEYPEQNAVAWYYKKEDGGAAAVFFKEKKKDKGDWQVYNLDYNFIKQKVVEGDS